MSSSDPPGSTTLGWSQEISQPCGSVSSWLWAAPGPRYPQVWFRKTPVLSLSHRRNLCHPLGGSGSSIESNVLDLRLTCGGAKAQGMTHVQYCLQTCVTCVAHEVSSPGALKDLCWNQPEYGPASFPALCASRYRQRPRIRASLASLFHETPRRASANYKNGGFFENNWVNRQAWHVGEHFQVDACFFCSKIVKTNKLNMLVHFPCFVYKADFLHKHAERRQPSSIPNTSHIVKSWRHIWNQFKNFKKEGRVCVKNIDCSFTFANGQRM